MIAFLLCSAGLNCFAPPLADAKVFGDKNPVSIDLSRAKGMPDGALNLRDFSSSLTRTELSDRIASLPVTDTIRQAIVQCATENYPAYIAAHGEVTSRLSQKYIDMCGSLATERKLTGKEPVVQRYRDQVKMASEFERELIACEQSFIQLVQECFNKSQASSGQDPNLLESWRLRAEYRFSRSRQRGANLDLRSFIDQLKLEFPLRQDLELELIRYEQSLAALKPALSKAMMDRCPKIRAQYEQLENNIISGDYCVAQVLKISAICGNIGKQIRNEALATVIRLNAILPSGKQHEFERMVRKAMFAELETDSVGNALDELFGESLPSDRATVKLSRETIVRIELLREEWKVELAAWRLKTEDLLLEWSDGDCSGINRYNPDTLKVALDERMKERDAIHERWRAILLDQLPSSTIDAPGK